MLDELEEYYEAAGFSNVYEKVLKNKTDEEIINLYKSTFDDENEV